MNDDTINLAIQQVSVSGDLVRHRMAELLNLNSNDLIALHHLIIFGPMQPAQLAKRLNLTTAATTTLVDRLAEAGHVERCPHPEDGRRLIVKPTQHAYAEAEKVLMPLIERVCAMHAALSSQEKKVVLRYLHTLTDIYVSYAAKPKV